MDSCRVQINTAKAVIKKRKGFSRLAFNAFLL
jgi:hypothetical protein